MARDFDAPSQNFSAGGSPLSMPELLRRNHGGNCNRLDGSSSTPGRHCIDLHCLDDDPAMGFNRRKMEAQRKVQADAEAAAWRAPDAQGLRRLD
jgi:hypothetical protein